MPKHSPHRPSSSDTRQLLAHLIEARQQYSLFLRGVANGQRQPDTAEKVRLKTQCDQAHGAWQAAHEAWRLDSAYGFSQMDKNRDN